jgi:cellulose synthase (UDP-forming)
MKGPLILDGVDRKHRIILWVLITIGIEAVLYYAGWWFEPQHRKSLIFFALLSFAIFYGVYRSVVNWFYFLFINGSPRVEPAPCLSVDVFTTAMPGEPYDMFEKTLTAIAAIRYPHQAYLLDGGNDPMLDELCGRLRIHHIDCRNVKGAKAGKVNYGLSLSTGEFILVIDPDHIPEPDFLHHVLGHFQDPEVGFVQVVQGYYNQGESIVARAGAEQTYGFYGPTMMGMNGLGATVAIGANCTFRRAALQSIGGHAVDLAEDLLTSVRLHAKRWKSVYVPLRLSFGLNPADLHSYFKQQLKWATGMFLVFFRDYFRLWGTMRWNQKLHYFFAGTYYFEGLTTAITCLLPILFLFFGLWAVEMNFSDFLLHVTPYAVMTFLIGWFVQRWYRDPSEKGLLWRGMVLKKGTWPIFLLGFLYCLTQTKVPYLPTPKTAEKGIFTNLVVPHLTVMILSGAAILYCLATRHHFVTGTILMMFFAACNIALMAPTVIIAHANWFSRNGRQR